jgi:hypothetical protein
MGELHRAAEITEGSVWAHYNGNLYRVVAIANLPDKERYPKTVVYQNVENGTMWARRFDDWHRSMRLLSRGLP